MYIKGHHRLPLAFAVITNDRSFIGLAMQGRIQDFQIQGAKKTLYAQCTLRAQEREERRLLRPGFRACLRALEALGP